MSRLLAILLLFCAPLAAAARDFAQLPANFDADPSHWPKSNKPAMPTAPAHTQPPQTFAANHRPSLPAVPANIHPAVVRIVAPGNGSISYGSGTLVHAADDWALVVTNWHVINEATGQISVHFPDGFYSLGTVRAADKDWDLAAIAIRRPPSIEPVRLAESAPRPGEMLTIAGYGSGQYRAANGQCTQYVAPGTNFPYEMVEVAVSARQGDSGGPILNNRGELAGVLFGEGHGRTSGSYCGRVRWFMTNVVKGDLQSPAAHDKPQMLVAAPARPIPEITVPSGRQAASAYAAPASATQFAPRFTATPSAEFMAARPVAPASLEPQNIGWHDIAGHSFGEQVKTVLAAVGVTLLLVHALTWMSREPQKA